MIRIQNSEKLIRRFCTELSNYNKNSTNFKIGQNTFKIEKK